MRKATVTPITGFIPMRPSPQHMTNSEINALYDSSRYLSTCKWPFECDCHGPSLGLTDWMANNEYRRYR